MRDLKVSTRGIVPLGEFKANASRLLRALSESDDPLVITQNGRPAAVVLSPGAFEELRERQRFLEAVAAGLADAEAGRTVEHKKVKEWLATWGAEAERDPPR
jgi:prevent-host-death family protein